jgi:hypothetical protein
MAVFDLSSSQVDRIGNDHRGYRARAGQVRSRAKSPTRTALEIGATFSVLVLIMVGALALRLLLSLPHGVVH